MFRNITLIIITIIGFMFSGCGKKDEKPAWPINLEPSSKVVLGNGNARKIVSSQPVESDVPGYWKVAFDAGIPLHEKAYFVALAPKTLPDSLLVYGEEIFVRVIYLHDSPQMAVYLGVPVSVAFQEAVPK